MAQIRAWSILFILLSFSLANVDFDLNNKDQITSMTSCPGSVQVLFLTNKANSYDGDSTKIMTGKGNVVFSVDLSSELTISKNSRLSLIARTDRYDVALSIYLGETFLGNITLNTLDWAQYSFMLPKTVTGNKFTFRTNLDQRTNFYLDTIGITHVKIQERHSLPSLIVDDVQIMNNPLAEYRFNNGVLHYSLQRDGLIRIMAREKPLCMRPQKELKILVYNKIVSRGKVSCEIKMIPFRSEYILKQGQMAEILAPSQSDITIYGCN